MGRLYEGAPAFAAAILFIVAASLIIVALRPAHAVVADNMAAALQDQAASQGPLFHRTTITCAVRKRGSITVTYFCQDGYTCDFAHKKCLPGPAIRRKAAKLLEDAKRSAQNFNRTLVARRATTEAEALGYTKGQHYSGWNGNPKIMPTPQYRRGYGYYPRVTGSRPIRRTRVPHATALRLANVSPSVQSQIISLVNAAASFQRGDPNRTNITNTLRKVVRDNKIPIDIDDLLGDCSAPHAENTNEPNKPSTYKLRWRVPDIPFEIKKRGLCKDAKDQGALDACQRYQFGQVIMSVEPEIKALCKAQENDFQEKKPAALGECASRKFINAWALRDGNLLVTRNTASSGSDRQCDLVEASSDDAKTLRERLRKLLAALDDEVFDDGKDSQKPEAQPSPTSQPVTDQGQPDTADIDDAFCAFIAHRSARGELTPGGGAKIPAYCRQAIDSAKTCAEQKCSMADLIDEQEKDAARPLLPWGTADYQAVEVLER